MNNLRQSIAVYRMVFGQSRQEDLVSYLIGHVSESDLQAVAKDLRMDMSPPKLNNGGVVSLPTTKSDTI